MLLYEYRDSMQSYAIQELMLCYAGQVSMQVYVFQCIYKPMRWLFMIIYAVYMHIMNLCVHMLVYALV